jgi:sugar/nucleoside kinase (ribokinase family)
MNGLFVGLTTLDLIYLTDRTPDRNQKIVAKEQEIAAGAPATNAAITFSWLGDRAKLLTFLGDRPVSKLIRQDLDAFSVEIEDLNLDPSFSPSVSSIIVTESTGERAVVSTNATKIKVSLDRIPQNILEGVDIVLIDGHLMDISAAIAPIAKAKGIPVVIDGGSWKNGWENVLPYVDYAICSADFYPPNCRDRIGVWKYITAYNIPYIAITNGEKPIECWHDDRIEKVEKVTVSPVQAIDTLGAGDIFHGAFCHYILKTDWIEALRSASAIATRSCQFFGTRGFLL